MSRMVYQYVRQFGQKLVHRRGADTIKESDGLKIHLSATELVFLGVGRNLGAGLYIVLGAVAKYVAGPAIVVCFLVAGLSSLLSRLCYVEFDARVPRSSSAYVCSYVMMGQLWAFVVGWNIILLFLIGEVMGPGDRCGGKVWGLRSGNWEMGLWSHSWALCYLTCWGEMGNHGWKTPQLHSSQLSPAFLK